MTARRLLLLPFARVWRGVCVAPLWQWRHRLLHQWLLLVWLVVVHESGMNAVCVSTRRTRRTT